MTVPSASIGGAARRASQDVLAAAILLASAACAVQPTAPARSYVEIDSTNRALWLTAEEAKGYRCAIGLLECRDVAGRLSARRCRCAE